MHFSVSWAALRSLWKRLQRRHVLSLCLREIYRSPRAEREVGSAGLPHPRGCDSSWLQWAPGCGVTEGAGAGERPQHLSPSPVSCCRWHARPWLGQPRRGSASLGAFQLPGDFRCPRDPRFPLGIFDLEAPSSSPPGGFSPRGALCRAILNIQIHFYACPAVEGGRLPLWHANESRSAAQGLSRGTRPSPRHFPQVAPWSPGGVGGARGSFLRLPRSFLHLLLSGRRGEGSRWFLREGGNDIFKAQEQQVGQGRHEALASSGFIIAGAGQGAQHPQGWGWGGQGCSRTSLWGQLGQQG